MNTPNNNSKQHVITRFAPSPTGFLHLGGARTALFNWLFSRHHGGQFLLRIEDTDRKRSSQEAIDAIYSGLQWLGITHDGDAVSQFARADRHRAVAEELLGKDKAYRCYCTAEELHQMREKAMQEGRPMRYDRRWRDRDPSDAPAGIQPVIRLKAPQTGQTVLWDQVQGTVTVQNDTLDDMILLRSDGTPTYTLAVVVDDHDMDITHVIRGDDHLNNAFRQYQLYEAMNWTIPEFAHIPLIHGADGAKLSKRHGALGIEAWQEQGFLAEAMANYLLRLGWAHGDDEIISTQQAIEWFSLTGIGKSPARFDTAKLTNLNAHYMKQADDASLAELALPLIEKRLTRPLNGEDKKLLHRTIKGLKTRAKNVIELADAALFYFRTLPMTFTPKAVQLWNEGGHDTIIMLMDTLTDIHPWNRETIEAHIKAFADNALPPLKLGAIAQPLRVALTGDTVSPSVFEIMDVLGRDETLLRLRVACGLSLEES